MKNIKSIFLWVLAFILTATIAIYQRVTGPTHPIRSSESLNGQVIKYKLLRSYTAFENLPVDITVPDTGVTAVLSYKRYKLDEPRTKVPMQRKGELLSAHVPGQAVAGKVEYTIEVRSGDEVMVLNNGEPAVARFKGAVPNIFLIPHIIFMFLAILLALRTAMETLKAEGNFAWMINWTLGLLFAGGLILGPIVQKYAFGDLWTGFPFGTDLTDNKVLIIFIFWIVAFFLKKKSKWWVFAAVVATLVIYLIPHSVLGSELDYSTGKMKNKYGFHMPPAALRGPRGGAPRTPYGPSGGEFQTMVLS
ncbi:MAG: hypothetical protein GY765_07820 [bacterium]|nr:hypothetical protein [bacterium]